MRLYAHVMPVCSIDAPAVSGVVLELWSSVWDRDACIQSYPLYDYMQAVTPINYKPIYMMTRKIKFSKVYFQKQDRGKVQNTGHIYCNTLQ